MATYRQYVENAPKVNFFDKLNYYLAFLKTRSDIAAERLEHFSGNRMNPSQLKHVFYDNDAIFKRMERLRRKLE